MTAMTLLGTSLSHAQQSVGVLCMPNNDLTDPYINLPQMDPVAWAPGGTYTVTINGTFPVGNPDLPGCTDVYFSAWMWPDYPNAGAFGPLDPYVTLSNFVDVSPTVITYTVSISPAAPLGSYVYFELYPANSLAFERYYDYWGVQIENPGSPGPGCATPAISSVFPSNWTAGDTYPVVIMGSGFTTQAEATSSCPATQMTVSVATGAVTVSNVAVINPSEIIATIAPAGTDPT
ncbi:MAG TPA: hypothetical protein VMD58_01775, partial [Acidobacteriaceae bacterium]|nr:hypothetical protein [Acidobacteriaceae bacterium]